MASAAAASAAAAGSAAAASFYTVAFGVSHTRTNTCKIDKKEERKNEKAFAVALYSFSCACASESAKFVARCLTSCCQTCRDDHIHALA